MISRNIKQRNLNFKVPYCAVAMVEEIINEEDELFGHTSPTPSR